MMIKVIMEDNERFEAESFEELVAILKLDMWVTQTKEDFMAGVARRCEVWNGEKISYRNADEFIKELQRVGVIKMIWSDGK